MNPGDLKRATNKQVTNREGKAVCFPADRRRRPVQCEWRVAPRVLDLLCVSDWSTAVLYRGHSQLLLNCFNSLPNSIPVAQGGARVRPACRAPGT